jgi:NAD(P)-dependent dehydrogenase (short-subunit alcohol dehydrogenase family)
VRTLEGKAVVVTGSGRGLGAEYAKLAAREGASVVLNDIDATALDETVESIRSEGGTCVGVEANITDWAESERLIEACVENFGAIDGLVNNAGIQMMGGPKDELDEALLRRMFDVNVIGTIFCGTHALRRMFDQGSGSVVNVSSGSHVGLGLLAPYGASKGAVASLTYCWAVDTEGTGVRVNAISPLGATRLAAEFLEFVNTPEDEMATMLEQFPEPARNAPAVVYLLSDLAEGVSGQMLRIENGRLCMVSRPAPILPSIENPDFSVPGVASVVDNSLRQHFQGAAHLAGPVGDRVGTTDPEGQ